MIKIPVSFVLVAALSAASTVHAQNVASVLVGKTTTLVQTDAATVMVDPRPPSPTYGGAFGFEASVWGTDLAGITPPSVTVPPTSGIITSGGGVGYNGGVLGYDAVDGDWNFGFPNFDNWAAPTIALRDALFRFGMYVFSVDGATVALNLTPSSPPIGPGPRFTLTGGAWSNGRYVIDVNDALTITSSSFTGYAGAAEAIIAGELTSELGVVLNEFRFKSDNPGAPDRLSATVPAGTLVAGTEYELVGVFANVRDRNTVAGLPDSDNFAYMATRTKVVIDVIGDVTPPVIHAATATKATLWPANHKMVHVGIVAEATDETGPVQLRIVSVTSNEADEGDGDGHTTTDAEITGPMSVSLRAERSGSGTGRIYTITIEASDAAGNISTADVLVTVPKNQGK